MNGVSTSNAYDGGVPASLAVGPGPRQIMDGYRKDVLSGLATNQRFNIVSCATVVSFGNPANAMHYRLPLKGHMPLRTSI